MRIILALFLLLSFPVLAESTAYFSALSDLPVAPNMTEDRHSAVRFDQPEGRIIVLQASGSADPAEIRAFYARTLPALGWTPAAPGRYVRGKEALLVDIRQGKNKTKEGDSRLSVLLRPL